MGREGKLIQRPMSISSPSTDLSEYEFFIRLVEGGGFTPLLWELTLGDPINIKGPKGKFLLQDDGNTLLLGGHRHRPGAVHEHARHAAR